MRCWVFRVVFVGLCIASKNSDMTINATLETQKGHLMQLFDFSICPFSEKAQKQPVHARMAKTQTPSSVSRPKLGLAGSVREKLGQKPVGFFRWIFVGT